MTFLLKRIDEHGNYITEHCTEETARRATEFRLRARLALHVQHDLHRALPAEGDGQQRLQAGQATHSGSYLTWNFFFLSMSSDFDPVVNPILKVGCVLFAFFTCLTRVSDYKHHPEVARTKKTEILKNNNKFNKYKNSKST